MSKKKQAKCISHKCWSAISLPQREWRSEKQHLESPSLTVRVAPFWWGKKISVGVAGWRKKNLYYLRLTVCRLNWNTFRAHSHHTLFITTNPRRSSQCANNGGISAPLSNWANLPWFAFPLKCWLKIPPPENACNLSASAISGDTHREVEKSAFISCYRYQTGKQESRRKEGGCN